MSEYIFGTTKEKLTKKEAARRNRIAKKHGAVFVGPIILPGNPTTGWFAKANEGHPFDRETAHKIMAEIG